MGSAARESRSASGDSDAAWTVKGGKACYGYKVHVAVGAEMGFVVAAHATPANQPDCLELMTVEKAGYFDGIMYKAARNRPLSEAQRLVNKAIGRVRGKVERAFGPLKKDHRMARARYLGTAKVGLQLLLDAMAFNLKKAARLVWA
ncbi:MAG: transposase [Pseudomonadota bacterium]